MSDFQKTVSELEAEIATLRAERDAASSEPRKKLAEFMMAHSVATGHGDTVDDLLGELGHDIEKLRAARAVTEWWDIATAPKDGTKVWAFGSGWFCPSIIAADGEWWRMRQAEGYTGQPTHWMPLQVPAPPLPLKAKP